MEILVTASIVLYRNDSLELQKAIESVLNTNQNLGLYLIDNSPTADLKFFKELDPRIIYMHNPTNPGFGSAHNMAIEQSINSGSSYHFIINPDIHFEGDVISTMVQYMQNDDSIGMMMPQILNEDGTVQNLPKLLPTPLSIFWRKIKKPTMVYEKFINKYELRLVPHNMIYNVPILSGCFTLLNVKAIQEIGAYDDDYFMYFEDWDLSRRMHAKYKTLYFPLVSVYHGYEGEANRSFKLFKIYISSAHTYFKKWGWIFDSNRSKVNEQVMSQFK